MSSAAPAHTPPPAVSAKGAYLLDGSAGGELYAKAASTRREMASTTKIMTAAVVLDTPGLDLDRKVKVKQSYRDYVFRHGASTADLQTGDRMTIRQLLYALMLPSGCDAAYALADTFGAGATESSRTVSFIARMNKKAAALGMTNTRFDSFDGVSDSGANYSTPKDLAKLAGTAMKVSTFRGVVKTTKITTGAPAANGNTRTYTWTNTNQMLSAYDGTLGIKTGTSTPAGPCLVFAAEREGRTVIGVVLNGADRYPDAGKLLDYAFGTSLAQTEEFRSAVPAGEGRTAVG
ncbi:D-alanyl-D-alanine carboxypeptidase family protein [Streptomyces sp. NPDC020681]|uniref:D-alanyl-D-alanine carboxypeptidase family protein n=1 Tax=Streptomyces sp. NPDC020681 TaxID=3365083 RepID=UPI00379313B7